MPALETKVESPLEFTYMFDVSQIRAVRLGESGEARLPPCGAVAVLLAAYADAHVPTPPALAIHSLAMTRFSLSHQIRDS